LFFRALNSTPALCSTFRKIPLLETTVKTLRPQARLFATILSRNLENVSSIR